MARVLGVISIVVLGVFAGWLGVLTGDRDVPTTVYRTEVLALRPWPGGEVQIRYFVKRHQSCATYVQRTLFDSQQLRIPLPSREFAASPGPVGEDSYLVSVPIPEGVALGPANYRVITTYVCNFIHNLWPIVVVAKDVGFEIGPKP